MSSKQDLLEVLSFVKQYSSPSDTVLASDKFSGHLKTLLTYSASRKSQDIKFQWAILSESELGQISPRILSSIPKRMLPVYTNQTYIVFTSNPNAVAIYPEHPNLKSLLRSIEWIEARQGLSIITKFPKLLLKSKLHSFQQQEAGLKSKIKAYRGTSKLLLEELREEYFSQLLPIKPTILNLMVNDVCNSRCQMCLIWKNKKDKEFSPSELTEVLNENLFSNLQYVGVSGGEPTLRKDLPELFEVICNKKPKILGTGIITNGIIEETVRQQVLKSAEICRSKGVPFNVMISLDGIGDVHDAVRGRENNFKSALSLIHFFKEETDIPVSFGCTITSSNAPYVDEFLDYVKEQGLYGRFRIAEFIDRLYNEPQSEFIRAFDDRTAYHLALFFFRLEHDYETTPMFQKTYRNIRAMLGEQKPRQIGCQYQTRGAVLTARGDLLYCSPKSPILGNALEQPASSLYFSNIAKRVEVIKNHCDNCIHDYHQPITIRETLASRRETRRRKKYECSSLLEAVRKVSKAVQPIRDIAALTSKSVLIVGWYGTETVGDKAILWSVIQRLRNRIQPPNRVYLASLYPFVSRWTIREMELGEIAILETYSKEFEDVCDQVDEVVVGGGPLMDIEPLNHILYAFSRAAKRRAIARVEGCGIGPLKSPLYTQVVSEIFRLSDHISLRDLPSVERCHEEFGRKDAVEIADPAVEYVLYQSSRLTGQDDRASSQPQISCFLREWTPEYLADVDPADYEPTKCAFEMQLARLVSTAALRLGISNIGLFPMHTFHVGWDDRCFNRRFSRLIASEVPESDQAMPELLPELSIDVERMPVSPVEILQVMQRSRLNLCMRFHSVLFAETLGIPYVAIDYTSGGKIAAFLKTRSKLDQLISLREIASGAWEARFQAILDKF
ncbi:polysaccharide pyruvyl transferase family protein [Thermoleptolyngbya sp. C42_A2020_037]|uniref:polysaccharide pyruvyl transferase family protein n=1 Tax=Thermoleptolyngbya sp. C42_A2020_037 TaxID=2747799 RepID=UPI0025D3787A|nr:polysaccharide pyruvyl transferase family protein [Thermoleptolyngbya sp. C42_A2020_037]